MLNSRILKALVAIAIIVGGIYVIMGDDPAVPTGDINSIQPLPEQDAP
ncbi:hypothetical protein HLV39_03735 [Marinobacter adhaerens]|uniref:Uncharacterized protein n=1 Tax=Marinobacter adhaerens TaxID=1033846 RepID=A0A851HNL8_9GAMM|nr:MULTISPECIES: hypothetical protein [Marinobacter]NWN90613.1 hypothetical protein [Marinobacter adhaerens]